MQYRGFLISMRPELNFVGATSASNNEYLPIRLLLSLYHYRENSNSEWAEVTNRFAAKESNSKSLFFEHWFLAEPSSIVLNNKTYNNYDELIAVIKANRIKRDNGTNIQDVITRATLAPCNGQWELECIHGKGRQRSAVTIEGEGQVFTRQCKRTGLPFKGRGGDLFWHLKQTKIINAYGPNTRNASFGVDSRSLSISSLKEHSFI